MRKIIVSEYLSLDGVMENPAWTVPYWNDEIAQFKSEEFFASDALLLGRITYEAFAVAWPGRTDEDGFADRINSMPKFVASNTVAEMTWNASPLNGNVVEAIGALKEQAGQNLLVYGSGELVDTLIRHGLVDEYRLLVYPVVLGTGKRLFKANRVATLKLVETKPFSSGVIAQIYHPVEA